MWNRTAQTISSVSRIILGQELIQDATYIARNLFSRAFWSDVETAGNVVAAKVSEKTGQDVKQSLTIQKLEENTHQFVSQALDGFSPGHVAVLPKTMHKYPESRSVTWSALIEGAVSYAMPVFAYHTAIRPVIMLSVAGTWISYPVYGVEAVAHYLYFKRAAKNLDINMFFYALGISKTTLPTAEEIKKDNDLLVPCPQVCGGAVDNFTASLEATVNSLVALKALQLVDWSASSVFTILKQPSVPILGSIATFPFLRLIEGRLLVGYKLAALGKCTHDREAVLSANNGYCFGKGLSYYLVLKTLGCLTTNVAHGLVWLTTGINLGVNVPFWDDNSMVEEALSYFVWLSFSVAEVQPNNPLPGKEKGVEIFYYPNLAVAKSFSFVTEKLGEKFKAKAVAAPKPEDKPLRVADLITKEDKAPAKSAFATGLEKVKKTYASIPVKTALTCVKGDLRDPNEFRKRDSIDHFAKIYGDDLHASMAWFQAQREITTPSKILRLVPERWLAASTRETLIAVRKEHWDEPLEFVMQVIHWLSPSILVPAVVGVISIKEASVTPLIEEIKEKETFPIEEAPHEKEAPPAQQYEAESASVLSEAKHSTKFKHVDPDEPVLTRRLKASDDNELDYISPTMGLQPGEYKED